jgi:hypothetical protein
LPIGENNSVNLMPLYYEGNAHRYPNNWVQVKQSVSEITGHHFA